MARKQQEQTTPAPAVRELADHAAANDALGELAKLEAEEAKLTGQRDAAVAKAGARFAGRLAEISAERVVIEAGLESFTRAHEDELDPEQRNLEVGANGRVQLRKTPPKLEVLEGLSWEDVVARIRERDRRRWFRTDYNVEKETVKADFLEGKATEEELAEMGMTVTTTTVFKYKLAKAALAAATAQR